MSGYHRPEAAEEMAMRRMHFVGAAVALVTVSSVAIAATTIKIPRGFRHWYLFNSVVIAGPSPVAGYHDVHVNDKGVPKLKTSGPYPKGTIFADDIYDYTTSGGQTSATTLKAVAVMVKDHAKYPTTGGWGFQVFANGDPTKPQVTDAVTQCFGCHQPEAAHDFIIGTPDP
jgi:hypothetical protein